MSGSGRGLCKSASVMWQGGTFLLYEFNSTDLDCMGKIRNPKNSYILLRQINDELCKAHGLSVIEKPKKRNREEMPAVKYGKSHKEQLR